MQIDTINLRIRKQQQKEQAKPYVFTYSNFSFAVPHAEVDVKNVE